MFGFIKKEKKPYRVMHYEGIDGMGINIPCSLSIENNVLKLNFNSNYSVSLSMEKIIKFEAMNENEFMMKYKGATSNLKNKIGVSYLVITYNSKENTRKQITLWAANAREIMFFTDLHYKYKQPVGNVEL